MSIEDTDTTNAAPQEPPPSPEAADLPPTTNVVLQAARAVDMRAVNITDPAAVAADVARSRIAGDVITSARQRHEIAIARCNDTLAQIGTAMQTIRDTAAARMAEVERQMTEDLDVEMQRARAVEKERLAATAAIHVLDS